MENRQRPLPIARPPGAAAPWTPWTPGRRGNGNERHRGHQGSMAIAEYYVLFELPRPERREEALRYLAERHETFEDLGPLLWYSRGTIAALLQDIVSTYRLLENPILLQLRSGNAINALQLLQSVATHNDTRLPLIHANIPLYVFPLLSTTRKTREYENLRIASLDLISALVKSDDSEAIRFLLINEVIPLCLHSMEMGTEISKMAATYVVLKIMSDEAGLCVICRSPAHFYAVANVLAQMVAEQPSPSLLRLIILCYLELTCDPRACKELRSCLPTVFIDGTLHCLFQNEFRIMLWLDQLLLQVAMVRSRTTAGPNTTGWCE